MGRESLVSRAMEGNLSNQGLQALDDDDDMLKAMARELVTHKGVGEKSDALWKQIQQQHTRLLATTSAVAMEPPQQALGEVDLAESGPLYPFQPELAPTGLAQLVLSRPRVARRPRTENDAQLSLAF